MTEMPSCNFHVRTPAEGDPGKFWFETVAHRYTPSFGGGLDTPHVPSVGDLVHLYGETEATQGMFRVLDRAWMYVGFGSADWPHGQARPRSGPIVDIVVEPARGMFADQVLSPAQQKELDDES